MSPAAQSIPVSAHTKKLALSEDVGIGAKLRKEQPWFETLIQKAKDAAIKKRRQGERARGAELTPERIARIADELEEVQRQINPLENRRKELGLELLAHWGHTGIEEIEHPLGKTLISTSFEMAVDPATLKEAAGDTVWAKITERTVQAQKLLSLGRESTLVRDAIEKAVAVRKLKVSVTPPASRRPKSGATDEESNDAE